MSDDISEILKLSYRAIHIAPLVIMAIISIVALVKQRFWIPVFIHLLAYGGAIVTFLVIMTIPRDQPYSIIELLGRLLLFPGAIYGVYITLGGPLYINKGLAEDSIIEHSLEEVEQLHEKYDFIKKIPWFLISWLIYCIIGIIFFTDIFQKG